MIGASEREAASAGLAAMGTTSWPLQYYFEREGIPAEELLLPINAADRLSLIVNTREGQTLGTFLLAIHGTAHPPRVSGYGPPRLLRRSADSAVYELRRIRAAPEAFVRSRA